MINWKFLSGLAGFGAFVSFIAGIGGGNPFGTVLLRVLISGLLFGGLGYGVNLIAGKFLPGLFTKMGNHVDIIIDSEESEVAEAVAAAAAAPEEASYQAEVSAETTEGGSFDFEENQLGEETLPGSRETSAEAAVDEDNGVEEVELVSEEEAPLFAESGMYEDPASGAVLSAASVAEPAMAEAPSAEAPGAEPAIAEAAGVSSQRKGESGSEEEGAFQPINLAAESTSEPVFSSTSGSGGVNLPEMEALDSGGSLEDLDSSNRGGPSGMNEFARAQVEGVGGASPETLAKAVRTMLKKDQES